MRTVAVQLSGLPGRVGDRRVAMPVGVAIRGGMLAVPAAVGAVALGGHAVQRGVVPVRAGGVAAASGAAERGHQLCAIGGGPVSVTRAAEPVDRGLSAVISWGGIDAAGLLFVSVGLGVASFCCPVALFGVRVPVIGQRQQLFDVDIAFGADLVPQIRDHVPAVSYPAAAVGSAVALVRGVVPLVEALLRFVHGCLPFRSPRRRGAWPKLSARRRGRPRPSTRAPDRWNVARGGITQSMASVTLAAEPASTRVARRLLRAACAEGGLSGDLTDTAQLLTSELVTNAIIHGRSQVTVKTSLAEGRLRVEVGDDNSRHPELRLTDDSALDGRGLHLVALLAASWGVSDQPFGKTVWFELAVA